MYSHKKIYLYPQTAYVATIKLSHSHKTALTTLRLHQHYISEHTNLIKLIPDSLGSSGLEDNLQLFILDPFFHGCQLTLLFLPFREGGLCIFDHFLEEISTNPMFSIMPAHLNLYKICPWKLICSFLIFFGAHTSDVQHRQTWIR